MAQADADCQWDVGGVQGTAHSFHAGRQPYNPEMPYLYSPYAPLLPQPMLVKVEQLEAGEEGEESLAGQQPVARETREYFEPCKVKVETNNWVAREKVEEPGGQERMALDLVGIKMSTEESIRTRLCFVDDDEIEDMKDTLVLRCHQQLAARDQERGPGTSCYLLFPFYTQHISRT